ncbi:MAG: EF-hand domain-containing protein [Pirellulaceae bacterium]
MRIVACMLILSVMTVPTFAQRGGRDGGGGDRGGRGGPPSGSFGGFRGGPPGGSSSGGRSGFDPTAMLSRFDRNGNGTIDADEREGFAGRMLEGLAKRYPQIDVTKPVQISAIADAINSGRGGSSGGDSRGGGPGENSGSDEVALLVPNFGLGMEPPPPEGFGAVSDALNIKIEERDIKESEERVRRYDKNKDNKLSKEELAGGRWRDDPMTYDRNKDGFLTARELAARYANQRVDEEERRSGGGRGEVSGRSGWGRGGDSGGWGRSGETEKKEEKKDRFGDAKSYRLETSNVPSGLPSFFNRNDRNGDGQLMMSEFSSKWDAKTLDEFQKWDLNDDGVILARECLTALNNGVRVDSSVGSSGSSSSSKDESGRGRKDTSSSRARSKPSSIAKSDPASQEYLDWAKKNIDKYDKNGDGALTSAEWEKMIIKPTGADADGDGVITLQEYATFRANKKRKK